VADAGPDWADGLPGELTVENGRQVLTTTTKEDDQKILRAAMEAGQVEYFGSEYPSLSEIFREAVA